MNLEMGLNHTLYISLGLCLLYGFFYKYTALLDWDELDQMLVLVALTLVSLVLIVVSLPTDNSNFQYFGF